MPNCKETYAFALHVPLRIGRQQPHILLSYFQIDFPSTANKLTQKSEDSRLTNRITASLKSYFPQVLDWFRDKDTQVFCEFIEQFDDVKAAQAATPETITQFFHRHHVVRQTTIQHRIQQIKVAGPPLTEDEAIVIPAKTLTLSLITLLKVVLQQLTEFNQQIAKLFESLPDAELFQALPGAGPHLAPRLLVAFGEENCFLPEQLSVRSILNV